MGLGIKTRLRRLKQVLLLGRQTMEAKPNLAREALLLAHALEKGMGVPDVKRGYGQEKANKLVRVLYNIKESGDCESYEFKESLAVLKAYCNYQKREGIKIQEIEEELVSLITNIEQNDCHGGYQTLNRDVLLQGTKVDFEQFIQTRHSMRCFSNELILAEEIENAIRLAKQAPSACNRQPWKLYYSMRRDVNKSIMSCVTPQSFLSQIPYFGVVTVDRSMFNDSEINQWYVNGGIFLAYLGLAFHHLGIGSCVLQYPVFSNTRNRLRSKLQIPGLEEIIAVIGYGKYPDKAKCIIACRKSDQDIAVQR